MSRDISICPLFKNPACSRFCLRWNLLLRMRDNLVSDLRTCTHELVEQPDLRPFTKPRRTCTTWNSGLEFAYPMKSEMGVFVKVYYYAELHFWFHTCQPADTPSVSKKREEHTQHTKKIPKRKKRTKKKREFRQNSIKANLIPWNGDGTKHLPILQKFSMQLRCNSNSQTWTILLEPSIGCAFAEFSAKQWTEFSVCHRPVPGASLFGNVALDKFPKGGDCAPFGVSNSIQYRE